MRVTESLIRQNKLKNKQNRVNEEETQCYQDRMNNYWALNQKKQAFDSPFSEGINTDENIFDKKALFRT